jgi:DNA-binding transcriptional MerR regulator
VVKAYVLRYWEQEFSQLKPVKRRGRRCYQQQDILLVRLIKKLLYEDGYTIDGARTQLVTVLESINQSAKTNIFVKKIISDLEGILQYLKKDVVIN